ncbi:MAG: DUF1987 domain-containing protein [Bacteroidales bacterium]|nr:DUF1987 domain-containing protein [Bacteroidales bacterium]
MEGKKIESTRMTPEVYLGPEGVIKFWGRSISEDSKGFFEEVNIWIDKYLKSPAEVTTVEFGLEYFNSASAKQLILILKKLSLLSEKQKKLIVKWFYEEGDEDILEKGEYFSSVLNHSFKFIKIT